MKTEKTVGAGKQSAHAENINSFILLRQANYVLLLYLFQDIISAYKMFFYADKEERIRRFADEKIGLFTKADIVQSCPDITVTTIEKVLGEMKREGIVKTVGAGRATKWCKTKE